MGLLSTYHGRRFVVMVSVSLVTPFWTILGGGWSPVLVQGLMVALGLYWQWRVSR